MRTLIAFDKFKGSLDAAEACGIAAAVVRSALPDSETEEAPLTDGGEGFAELLTNSAGGELRTSRVAGPLGQAVDARHGLVSLDRLPARAREILKLPEAGTLAVVEMAQASGLQRIRDEERDPWRATTRGTGELLLLAAESRPAAILLGVGGSATHDLGLGALQALGLRGRFASGVSGFATEDWERLEGFAGEIGENLPPIWIASDVENPLLGERGAAKVFAPQKGLRPDDLERLEEATAAVARLLCGHFGQSEQLLSEPGSGAAGGIGAGLRATCHARVVSGFSLVRAWMDLDQKLAEAGLVVTGEGKFDASSLEGKGPGAVVKMASKAGKRCLVLAGMLDLPDAVKRQYPSCRFLQISPRDWPLERAMAEANRLLEKATREALKDVTRRTNDCFSGNLPSFD